MELGAFSVSLAVRDLQASREFYEKLGFEPFGGDAAMGWLMMNNGDHVLGLFQGMLQKNMLTFNPGRDQSGEDLREFTDVRALREALVAKGMTPVNEHIDGTSGPGNMVLVDPDGNPILIDQHR